MTKKNLKMYTKYTINGYINLEKISQNLKVFIWHVIHGWQTLFAHDVQLDNGVSSLWMIR
jgi:hypothetical protein